MSWRKFECSNFRLYLLFGPHVFSFKLAKLFQRTFKTRGLHALSRLGLVRICILVILTLCGCTRGGRCEEWRWRVKANVCCRKSKSPQRPLHCEQNLLGEKMDAVFPSPPQCHKLPGHWSMGVWDSREDLSLYIYLAQNVQLSPKHKFVSWLSGLLLGYSTGLKWGALWMPVRCPAVLTKYNGSQWSPCDATPHGLVLARFIFLRDVFSKYY